MASGYRGVAWRTVPLAGFVAAVAAFRFAGAASSLGPMLPLVGLAVLIAVVFACVYHADVIAHRTGEPHSTLVLTVAVTVTEVALILSIMLAGEGKPALARETVFSVIVLVCNGLVGLCLVLGGCDTVLLVLTFGVSLVTFGGGRTNILPGFVHLVLFAVFVFMVFVP